MKYLKQYLFISDKGIKDLKKAIIACTISNFSLMLPFIITTLIFEELISGYINSNIDWNKMWILWGIGIICAVLVYLASRNDYEKTYINSYKESKNTRFKIARHLIALPMSFFNERDLTEITDSIMADCATMESMLSSTIPPLIANIISVTITCILLSFFEWRLAALLFSTLPIALFIIVISRRKQKEIYKELNSSKSEVNSLIQEYLEGIKIIKAYKLGGMQFQKLNKALLNLKKIAIKVELLVGVFISGSGIILQAAMGIIIFFGTKLLLKNQIDLLTLLMFLLISTRIYGPILAILSQLSNLLYMEEITKRMKELFSVKEMSGKYTDIDNLNIRLENVKFSYNKNETVIDDISLDIKKGNVIAFVGPSGSGKSTLMKLISRFWDIDSGEIIIGEKNIKEISQAQIMSNLSIVFQDVILFNDTVYNNIKIGRTDASEAEVIRAAQLAQCDEFINKLPNKYDTYLGENGSTLSGGERQRISIARSILKNAPIILLDEATASLDPENEVLIQKAISELTKDKRVIVIAHRLKTIKNADKIYVLNKGKIVESGTHAELLEINGLYKKMYYLQEESKNFNITK